eukprot:1578170-Rhodomonas_salina.1
MHEVKLNSTLVSDFPNLSATATPLWNADDVCVDSDAMQSALSCDMLALPHIESSPINIATADNASEPGGGSVIDDDVSDPGGGSPEARNSSAGEEQLFPKSCKRKGKRQRFGDKVPPLGEFTLPQDFFPEDHGKLQYTISCSQTCMPNDKDVADGFKRNVMIMEGIVISSPKKGEVCSSLRVPMSGRYLIRTAVKEAVPTARVMMDIISPPTPPPVLQSRIAHYALSVSSLLMKNTMLQRIKIDTTGNTNFVALMGALQVISMQRAYAFRSTVQAPEPKNQTEARSRSYAQDWIDSASEWVEMDTIYRMRTIVYIKNCNLPHCTTTISTKFTYKCKMGDEGQVIKKKGRLIIIRGDLQKEDEYTKTFDPTSRFNTLRALISIAAQERLKLVQFDIKGTFMVSSIEDKELYIELPKGYEAPEGYTARLNSSCYGTRDAAFRFWKTLSDWMIEYGFEAVNADKTLFRIKKYDGTLMIIALYVDDGLTAHNNDAEYAKFILALSERFELSTESTEVSWYLGVGIQRDWAKGTISLTQQQYVNDLLKRFEMTDCNP